jgi:hypothetical protein
MKSIHLLLTSDKPLSVLRDREHTWSNPFPVNNLERRENNVKYKKLPYTVMISPISLPYTLSCELHYSPQRTLCTTNSKRHFHHLAKWKQNSRCTGNRVNTFESEHSARWVHESGVGRDGSAQWLQARFLDDHYIRFHT